VGGNFLLMKFSIIKLLLGKVNSIAIFGHYNSVRIHGLDDNFNHLSYNKKINDCIIGVVMR